MSSSYEGEYRSSREVVEAMCEDPRLQQTPLPSCLCLAEAAANILSASPEQRGRPKLRVLGIATPPKQASYIINKSSIEISFRHHDSCKVTGICEISSVAAARPTTIAVNGTSGLHSDFEVPCHLLSSIDMPKPHMNMLYVCPLQKLNTLSPTMLFLFRHWP